MPQINVTTPGIQFETLEVTPPGGYLSPTILEFTAEWFNANVVNANSERRFLVCWLILGAGLLFYLLTLRPGHRAGDFAMYIQHTVNMAEGRPYAETGYVLNPASMSVGTANYPPGLPVLLLPIYLVSGLNLTAMKVLMVLLFMGSIYIFWRMTRDQMTVAFSAVMLLDLIFVPYFWATKDNVESDFPFLLPLFLSLWLIQHASSDRRNLLKWLLLGVLMYAAVAIRTVGLVLPMSLMLYDLVERRRPVPSLRFWVPTGVLIALMVVQGFVLPLESGGYASAFIQQMESPLRLIGGIIHNAKFYILACAGRLLLTNGHGTLWADILLVALLTPFAVGLITRLRNRIGILDVFFVVYAGILLVWPFRQPNYLIPAVPMLSFYVFVGLERLAGWLSPKLTTAVAVGSAGVLALTFGMDYLTLDFEHVPEDVMSPASMEFYQRVKETTPTSALILTRLPREIAFFTGRKATPPNLPADNRDDYSSDEVAALVDYIDQVGVDYAATGPMGLHFHREILPLWDLAEQAQSVFIPQFRNPEWRLYSVITRGAEMTSRMQ